MLLWRTPVIIHGLAHAALLKDFSTNSLPITTTYEDFFSIERYKHKHLAERHIAASLTEKPSLSMATLGSEISTISLLLRMGK